MKRFFYILLLVGLALSCTKDSIIKTESEINVSFTANNINTKVSYYPNISEMEFSWDKYDQISINSKNNINRIFTTTTESNSSEFSGKLNTWEGESDIYAIYPWSESISLSGSVIKYDNTTQVLDCSLNNKYSNSLLVAMGKYAKAEDADNYYIPELNFKQMLSFLKLDLKDIPENEIVSSVGFESELNNLITSSNIDIANFSSSAISTSSSIVFDVINHSGSIMSLNIAMIPQDLSGQLIKLVVFTTTSTQVKKYTYSIPYGLNFKSNHFMFNEALSLSDFSIPKEGFFYLSDFDSQSFPENEEWVILDDFATSEDFEGLRNALSRIPDWKKISISFPNLIEIPNNAFKFEGLNYALHSVEAPKVTNIGEFAFYNCNNLNVVKFDAVEFIGNYAFYNCSNINSINFPIVKSIGNYAFANNINLISVVVPNLTNLGISAFESCGSLSEINFPELTTIKSNTFKKCVLLKKALFQSVNIIEIGAFEGCDLLLYLEISIQNTIQNLSNNIFDEKLSENQITLATGIANKDFIFNTSIKIGNTSHTFKNILIKGVSAKGESGIIASW